MAHNDPDSMHVIVLQKCHFNKTGYNRNPDP